MMALSAPLLSLALLTTAPDAPVAPVAAIAPVPAVAPVPVVAPVAPVAPMSFPIGDVWVHASGDGRVLVVPGPGFTFTPGADECGQAPRVFEFVLPAGERRDYAARTETLITVPRGVTFQLDNLIGDIHVDAWDKDQVRIVAAHDRHDQLRARVIALRRQTEAVRRSAARTERERAQMARELARAQAEIDRAQARQIQASLVNRVLQVETLNRLGLPAAVDYTITVPRWMALRLSGMETDISIDGVQAAIEAESIRGDVRVRGGRGPVSISSVEGAVRALDVRGQVQASSINNDIDLEDVDGMLAVESVNGDIRIRKVKSSNVEASSVNGTVVYGGAFEPRGRYRLASHAGNLVVGVPVGAGVDVSVATFEGGFRSGFPVQVGPWRKGQKFNFVLGTGGSTLELESFQGLIELLRPEEVPAALEAERPSPVAKPGKAPKAPKIIKVYKGVPAPPAPPDAPDEKENHR